jgi:hypothetical protein
MLRYASWYTALPQETRRKVGWLSEVDIAAIRKRLSEGVPRLTLAREYKVSYRTIQRIDLHQRTYA